MADVHGASRVLRFVSLAVLLLAFSACDWRLGCRQTTVWRMGVLAVLQVSVHVVLTLNKIPRYSGFLPGDPKQFLHYTVALVPLILFLLSFALCFHFLLMNNRAFSSIPIAFVKTITLMLGDLDYDDTFVSDSNPVRYEILANVLFLVFIVCIGGIVMNFAIGGPAEELYELRKEEQLNRAIAHLHIHLLIDECAPKLRRKFASSLKLYERKKHFSMYVCSGMFQEGNKKASEEALQLAKLTDEVAELRSNIQQLLSHQGSIKDNH
ncbi:uncharacterized protein LOC108666009 [Hyalella azteca]|uniref:Uncharacterized protein LOC108666009 n=1 Tax=Hyalella azteca TaxID=294128 RepID=A0A8B7N4N2_HYAAZ|nr:uncharacterized protein LOC108666009 [Hyalella azteca]